MAPLLLLLLLLHPNGQKGTKALMHQEGKGFSVQLYALLLRIAQLVTTPETKSLSDSLKGNVARG